MNSFCNICNKIIKCQYCSKYGHKGILVYLEKKMIHNKNKNKNYETIDINKAQLAQLARFNKG